jgi:phytoene dehydrogenase-like protein
MLPTSRSDAAADAVVIGAGHNGLVAANLLADAGWDVLLCEATPHIGGAVRSGEVTAPGFTSDLFSAFYPLSIASPVISGLRLEEHGLAWTHAPSVLAHVFPDDRCSVLSRDLDVTAASVEQFAPGDGDRWRQVVADWEAIQADIIGALFTPLPALGPISRLSWTLGAAGLLRFARQAVLPVRRYGEEQFQGEGAQLLLAGNALHADLPPEGAGSGLFGWLLAMLGQTYGFPVPVGGAGMLTQSMANRFTGKGGSIRLGAPVTRIEIVAGTAAGVRLESGERIVARRAVLADVAAPILYRDLVGAQNLSAGVLRDLDRFQWDTPTMKVDWALSGPIPWTADGARGAGTVHLGVDLDGLTRYAADLATKTIPTEPFALLGQMTTSDASRSPAGTESAWCYTHLPTGIEYSAEQIQHQLERIEAMIDRHAPGFRDLIVGRYVQSPARLEQENPSLVHGAINGGTAQLHQQLVFRPIPGLGGASTPIDRLYLAGSSAHPGGGVHGGPGSNAARAALRRAGGLGGARRQITRRAMNLLSEKG